MKKLTTLLMALMLMSTMLWADETITVSANSSDISEGLDLKVVAKLFAEAKNLEEFETMLNNPDSAFCNLDLNGDGQVDYLRVIETGEGNKRLIVLQAVLAKDIYQDVASIYVEKDANDQVSVQIIGDEYVYGTAYIIEPIYVYRPLIYDWFWCDTWYAWYSPWYWGYYPDWWYVHNCWARDWYWHRCYAWHHHHYCCSFHTGHYVHAGYHELSTPVTRRDYAVAHPDNSFSRRNATMTNAREIRATNNVRTTRTAAVSGGTRSDATTRTAGAERTTMSRSASTSTRSTNVAGRSTSKDASATTTRSTATATRSTGMTARSTSTKATRSTTTATRSANTTATRSTQTRSTASSSSSTRSSMSSSATRSSNSYSSARSSAASNSVSRASSYSGGGSRGGGVSSGGGSRGGGGGAVRR